MSFSQRDVKDVSALVAKKLEYYMNNERREERFDPQGCYRTTPKMKTLDLMYRMLDTAEFKKKEGKSPRSGSPNKDKKSRKSKKKSKSQSADESSSDVRNGTEEDQRRSRKERKSAKEKKHVITPCLVDNSRRVVPIQEAERLTQTANKVFEEQDLDKLHVIHRYRPHSPDVASLTENGKVANYTLHIGSALHSKKYVDYYMKEGLQSSKKEYAKRLQRLQSRKEEESSQEGKGLTESSSSAQDRKHKSSTSIQMQEILSPCQSTDSLSSTRSSTSRKLNPLVNENPDYNAFINNSPFPSRGSSGNHSKASSQLYKAKRYASGYGYRIIAENNDNIETKSDGGKGRESRAEIASSVEYSKFSGMKTELSESGREGFGSDIGDKKIVDLTDVEMQYKRYQIESVSASKEEEKESEDTRAQTNHESCISESNPTAASVISEYSQPSKDLDRSYHSNHSEVSGHSGTYNTQESDLYNSTQSEVDSGTARSISISSSTPRRSRTKRMSQEPIQTIINPPEVPRLGLPSDVNETPERASSQNSSVLEEYVTAEEKAMRHPDARAIENKINASQDRAKVRDIDIHDSRAEKSLQNVICSDELPVEQLSEAPENSLPPVAHVLSPKVIGEDKPETIKGSREDTDSIIVEQEKIEMKEGEKPNNGEKSHETSVVYSESDVILDCKENPRPKGKITPKRAKEMEGKEVERGEDEIRNLEFHRGEVPAIEKNKLKVKPERGDDTPRSLEAKGRLTKSAKRRGLSNYYTMGEDERGLEKEYFEPMNENDKEQYIPSVEQDEESDLKTPESSRPSSANSASSGGTLQSGSGKRKKSSAPTSIADLPGQGEKSESGRPQSAASKGIDGRGDDSNSVKIKQHHKAAESEGKEEAQQKEKMSQSACSNGSYGQDAQGHNTQVSVTSRGSITMKEQLGAGKGYSIEGEMLSRGLDENYDRKLEITKAKNEQETPSPQETTEAEKENKEGRLSPKSLTTHDSKQERKPDDEISVSSKIESQGKQEDLSKNEGKEDEEWNEGGDDEVKDDIQDKSENKKEANGDKNESVHSIKEIKSESSKDFQKMSSEDKVTSGPDKESKDISVTERLNQELPLEEKAFVETDSVDQEVIKEAASGSASLLISDGDTVIDFRPLSASTAISVGNDHDADHKRLSLPQPSKIVEVTEVESNAGTGRESQQTVREPIIPHPAEKKNEFSKQSKMHIVNIAEVKLESYEHIKEHPAMKRSTSEYISSKERKRTDLEVHKNLSLPLEKEIDASPSATPGAIKTSTESEEDNAEVLGFKVHESYTKTIASNEKETQGEEGAGARISPARISGGESGGENIIRLEKFKEETGEERKYRQESTAESEAIQEKSLSAQYKDENLIEPFLANREKVKESSLVKDGEPKELKASEKIEEPSSPKTYVIDSFSHKVENVVESSPYKNKMYGSPSAQTQNVKSPSPSADKGAKPPSTEAGKVTEPHLSKQEKVPELPSAKTEKIQEPNKLEIDTVAQPSLAETGKVAEIFLTETVKEVKLSLTAKEKFVIPSSTGTENMADPPINVTENVKEQLSIDVRKFPAPTSDQIEKYSVQPLIETEKVSEQPPVVTEKVSEQPTDETERVSEQPTVKREKVSEQPSVETEKVSIQPSVETEKVSEQPTDETERVSEKPTVETEKVSEQPSVVTEKVSEQPTDETERVSEQPTVETDKVSEQPPVVTEKVSEQMLVEIGKVLDTSSTETEKVSVTLSTGTEKVPGVPPKETEKVPDASPTEEEKIWDTASIEAKKVSDTPSTETGKVLDTPSTETEKVPDAPLTETEKVLDTALTQTDKVSGTLLTETEKIPETPSTETEKVPGTPLLETEKIPGPSPTETEKVLNTPSTETDKVPGTPLTETNKIPDTSLTETEKVPDTSPTETEKFPETPLAETNKGLGTPLTEAEKVPGTPLTEAEKVPGTPLTEAEKVHGTHLTNAVKVPETHLTNAEKVPETHLTNAEKVPETHLANAEKVPETHLTNAEKIPETPLAEAETVSEIPATETEKVPETSLTEAEKVPKTHLTEAEKVPKTHLAEAEKVPETPSAETVKVPVTPSTQSEKVSETSLTEAEKVSEIPATETEKAPETHLSEAEKVPEIPLTETEKVPVTPSTQSEKVPETPLTEAEIVSEIPATEIDKVPETPLTEAEKVPVSSSTESEKVQEIPFTAAEKAPETHLTGVQKLPDTPSAETEKAVTPATQSEKVQETPLTEAEKVQETPLTEAGKVQETPLTEAEKVLETLLTEAEKVLETPLTEAEKVSEKSLTEAEKVSETT